MSKPKLNASQSTFSLSLAALGVVYGDIGTSPLYAIRESIGPLPINMTDVLGVLSLIFWSLVIIISVKYLIVLFKADNDGEGGILALLALLTRIKEKNPEIFFVLGIFGAGLLLGDGMLTPAISVISAIEGLNVILPSLSDWVLPLTIGILVALFSVQSFGTEKIGFIFGPIIFIWFLTIGILGLVQILETPVVLKAVNPIYAVNFFLTNGWSGYLLLGGVFLVVTGGEALYADLGHFGKLPIRLSWFFIALPALLANYFGQGAFLITHPQAIVNPFYMLAPGWFSFPLLILATMATIIASQAVISATFSLTKQAVLLGLYPHLPIIQTSKTKPGQIFIPQINLLLALGTVLLVLTFRNSNALTHAYGIAVNLDMLLTTILTSYLALTKWRWNKFALILLFSFFGIVDIAYLGANAHKLTTGGWVPIVFAMICAFIMYTWNKGRQALQKNYYLQKDEFSKILKQLDYKSLNRLPSATAIFITDIYDKSGGSFLHFLKLNRTMPDHVLIVNYTVENIPYVSLDNRFEIKCLKPNICELTLHYGFMDTVSVPKALAAAEDRNLLPFKVNTENATYLIEIPNVVASRKKRTLWFFWQEKLFAFLVRNYSTNLNIEFYQVPFNRTIAIGTYYII
ncbi:KUP system potassium uptake protein (plasmid) [Legionella adelaidensis]|uniref:Probable potassium transport system protein Kup n=1 Tax=Legionella adelaidensis TaxID=45056 RepID=A0A0W0R680_9GAMM|nr:KUP/HAK/KT family potassium transporter [Legionella adelaidensis]KTC66584.1 KUP system potassium uptake protein [Legionella adelaidensis]VEH85491.1 KUP system potassium uptake protein [Legionella adelaidensis]